MYFQDRLKKSGSKYYSKPHRILKKGDNGIIYEVCATTKNNDCIIIKYSKDQIAFSKEVKWQEKAAKNNTSIKILDYYILPQNKGGIFIMNKMDFTFSRVIEIIFKKNPKLLLSICKNFFSLYEKLLSIGICHSDLHTDNIMMKVEPFTYKLVFIDFGQSNEFDPFTCGDFVGFFSELYTIYQKNGKSAYLGQCLKYLSNSYSKLSKKIGLNPIFYQYIKKNFNIKDSNVTFSREPDQIQKREITRILNNILGRNFNLSEDKSDSDSDSGFSSEDEDDPKFQAALQAMKLRAMKREKFSFRNKKKKGSRRRRSKKKSRKKVSRRRRSKKKSRKKVSRRRRSRKKSRRKH